MSEGCDAERAQVCVRQRRHALEGHACLCASTIAAVSTAQSMCFVRVFVAAAASDIKVTRCLRGLHLQKPVRMLLQAQRRQPIPQRCCVAVGLMTAWLQHCLIYRTAALCTVVALCLTVVSIVLR